MYLHIKDYVPELDTDRPEIPSPQGHAPRIVFFGELGTGTVDLPAILEVAREADYDGWLTVELDVSQTTPRESLEVNSRYLNLIFIWLYNVLKLGTVVKLVRVVENDVVLIS